MDSKKKFLLNDKEHARKTHYRWVDEKLSRNRDVDDPKYKDEWVNEPCFLCIYYIPLKGSLGSDWGVCSNPKSQFDSRVMFEHDGCDFFDIVDDDEY